MSAALALAEHGKDSRLGSSGGESDVYSANVWTTSDLKAMAMVRPAGLCKTWLPSYVTSPIALHTDKANEQHYELPPVLFSARAWPAAQNIAAVIGRLG